MQFIRFVYGLLKVISSIIKAAPDDENPAKVTDIEDKWYKEYAEFVLSKGIMKGDAKGTFRPNDNISRQEFVTAIKSLMEKKEAENPFTDVKEDSCAYEHIISAYANGFIKGYEEDGREFKPTNNITRAEVATIINNVIGKSVDLEANKDKIKDYTDLSDSHWAYKAVITATID